MSVISCRECGGKLSTLALTCPHGGVMADKTMELKNYSAVQTSQKSDLQMTPAAEVNK